MEGECLSSLGAPTTTKVEAFWDTDKNCKRNVTFTRKKRTPEVAFLDTDKKCKRKVPKKEVDAVLGTDWGIVRRLLRATRPGLNPAFVRACCA